MSMLQFPQVKFGLLSASVSIHCLDNAPALTMHTLIDQILLAQFHHVSVFLFPFVFALKSHVP
jgi:hypothetical protein